MKHAFIASGLGSAYMPGKKKYPITSVKNNKRILIVDDEISCEGPEVLKKGHKGMSEYDEILKSPAFGRQLFEMNTLEGATAQDILTHKSLNAPAKEIVASPILSEFTADELVKCVSTFNFKDKKALHEFCLNLLKKKGEVANVGFAEEIKLTAKQKAAAEKLAKAKAPAPDEEYRKQLMTGLTERNVIFKPQAKTKDLEKLMKEADAAFFDQFKTEAQLKSELKSGVKQ